MIKIKNCAIYGGTFDPIHNGHLHLIDAILSNSEFERLIIVPAGNPWQKKSFATAEERLKMLKLALAERDAVISDCEIRRSGPSYAIDTLTEIESDYPADKYTWILGSDAIAKIQSWHQFEELKSKLDFLVIKRPGTSISDIPTGVSYSELDIKAPDISATAIRARIASGQSIAGLVPESVASFIEKNGIYGAA